MPRGLYEANVHSVNSSRSVPGSVHEMNVNLPGKPRTGYNAVFPIVGVFSLFVVHTATLFIVCTH